MSKSPKPKSRASKPEVVTPTKPKQYSLLILLNGKHLPFTNPIFSARYEKVNSAAISAIHRFNKKEEMEAFQAKLTSSDKKNTKRNSSVLSPDQKEALARMKRIRTARHPHKAVSLLYKTTPFSTACALILDIVDYNGNTQWNFKAADHVENLQAYLECGEEISGTHTSDLINNFVLVERRIRLEMKMLYTLTKEVLTFAKS